MKYINTLLNTIKTLDIRINNIMKNGFKLSFILALFSTYLLLSYHLVNIPNLFYIGITLLKASLHFLVAFFIGAISFNTILKELGYFDFSSKIWYNICM